MVELNTYFYFMVKMSKNNCEDEKHYKKTLSKKVQPGSTQKNE